MLGFRTAAVPILLFAAVYESLPDRSCALFSEADVPKNINQRTVIYFPFSLTCSYVNIC